MNFDNVMNLVPTVLNAFKENAFSNVCWKDSNEDGERSFVRVISYILRGQKQKLKIMG